MTRDQHDALDAILKQANREIGKSNLDYAQKLVQQVQDEVDADHSIAKENNTLRVRVLLLFSEIERIRGNHFQAFDLAQRVLLLTNGPTDAEYEIKARVTIGIVYSNFGDYSQALEYLTTALEELIERGEESSAAFVTGTIAVVYSKLGKYDTALEYFGQALRAHERLGEKSAVARVTGNMGIVYMDLGSYDTALEYYGKALAVQKELGVIAGIAIISSNMGIVFFKQGRYEAALEYLNTSLATHEALGEKLPAAIVTGNIGSVYADEQSEWYDADKAEEYLSKALALCTEIGAKAQVADWHKKLAELYENQKRDSDALVHYKKYSELDKELNIEAVKKQDIIREQQKAMEIDRASAAAEKRILRNILPEEITQRLIRGENPIADHFDSVSILFMDIVGFTPLASMIPAQQLVHFLNSVFTAADGVMREFGLEKIKTIGDAYMAVAGAPVPHADHALRAAQAALKLLDVMQNLVVTFPDNYGDRTWIASIPEIQVRIGLHCGPVAAGVVGENKFLYDLWGDAVNTASRMESHGEAGKIHVSEEFKQELQKGPGLSQESRMSLHFQERGEMNIKGKGKMKTYFLEKESEYV